MSQIFFTADLHFSHKKIAKFCPHTRPNVDAQDDTHCLDEYMIALWNDTVSIHDDVYNLGDLTFAQDLDQIFEVLTKLNGRHHLIFGNHDDIIQTHLPAFLSHQKHDGNPILSSAQSYLKLKLANKTLILFHYPMAEWDGYDKGYYHLHGHIHNRMADIDGRILNVGFDLHGKFLNLDDIIGYLDDLPVPKHRFNHPNILSNLNTPNILTQTHHLYRIQADPHWQTQQKILPLHIKARLKQNNQ